MPEVMVAYASRMGGTAEIATVVADVMRDRDLHVTLTSCADAGEAQDYDAVIVGSALYLHQWEADAVHYLESQATALAERPTWLFQSGPCGKGAEGAAVETPRRVLRLVERMGLDEPVTFGGRLDRSKAAGPLSRWVASGELAGDYRDWGRIRTWADDLATQIHALAASGVSTELAQALGTELRKSL